MCVEKRTKCVWKTALSVCGKHTKCVWKCTKCVWKSTLNVYLEFFAKSCVNIYCIRCYRTLMWKDALGSIGMKVTRGKTKVMAL